MKGSTVFWMAIILSIIIKFDISLYNKDIYDFYKWNLMGFMMYEVLTGIKRTDEVIYKETKEFNWGTISIIWWIYVLIRYYFNPFLNKILK